MPCTRPILAGVVATDLVAAPAQLLARVQGRSHDT
jgi:hypothetical protein